MKIRAVGFYFLFCCVWFPQSVIAEVEVLFATPILWDKNKNSASISAEINGIATKLIIDTGSYPTILSEQFVRKLNLKNSKNSNLSIVEHPLEIKTENLTVNIPLFGIVHTSHSLLRKNEFTSGKYGGLLNPFLLKMGGNDRVMVIDFPRNQFYGIEGNKEKRKEHFDKYYKNYSLRFEVPYVVLSHGDRVMQGNIEGKEIGKIIFDTGANNTSFTAYYMRDEKVAKESKVINMKGEISRAFQSFPKKIYISEQLLAEVSIGMDAFETFVNDGSSRTEDYIGAIGLDILQHCAIAIEDTSDKMALFCQTPATEKSVSK